MATMNLNQILGQNVQTDATTTPADGPLPSKTLCYNRLSVISFNYNQPLSQSEQKSLDLERSLDVV